MPGVPQKMHYFSSNQEHIFLFHGHHYARKECLQLGHQISNIAPPLYNNSLQVNDLYSTGKLKFSYMLPGYKNLPLL